MGVNIDKLKSAIKEFKSTEQDAIKEIDLQLEKAEHHIKMAKAVSELHGVPFGVNFESGYVYIPREFGKLMTAVNDFARIAIDPGAPRGAAEDLAELHTLFAEYDGTLFHECDGEYWEASAFC